MNRINQTEILNEINHCGITEGYVLAMLTDQIIFDYWPLMKGSSIDSKEDKLLEIRVFNAEKEYKAFRSDISKSFICRIKDDSDNQDCYDELQYLDIDTDASSVIFADSSQVVTTGGGRYFLPFGSVNDVRIRIRNYIEKDPMTGKAIVTDWRAVGLEKE